MKTASKSASSRSAAIVPLAFRLGLTLATVLACAATTRADSLWPKGRSLNNLYGDKRAEAAGDILTIVVAESVAAQNSQSTKSSRDSSLADAVSTFLYPGLGTHKGSLPNGNLVIEGVRVVRFSGETQYVVLHGLVRPLDISAGNTVVSTNIADARVEFYSEGSLTDAQKRGWLAKVYEKLRPF